MRGRQIEVGAVDLSFLTLTCRNCLQVRLTPSLTHTQTQSSLRYPFPATGLLSGVCLCVCVCVCVCVL